MRFGHALAAGSAVALLSAATTLMASTTASAAAPAQPATAAAAASLGATSTGSAAGLLLGLLFVLAVAGVSFIIRTGATRRTPIRVISIPEARVARTFAPAFAE